MNEDKPKGSCNACGNLKTIIMGERGPIKVDRKMQEMGHFRFCWECLSDANFSKEGSIIKLHINSGSAKGESWFVHVQSTGR